MDDWATSSPWAETTDNGDDFDDFQSGPPVSNAGKEATETSGGTNGFSPFKVNKEPFGNGWGFENHAASADVGTTGGWHPDESELTHAIPVFPTQQADDDKLKPAKSTWEYKNEWAKSQESLAPSESSNIWNKPDDWEARDAVVPEATRTDISAPEPTLPDTFEVDDDPNLRIPFTPVVEIEEEASEFTAERAKPSPTILKDEPPVSSETDTPKLELKQDELVPPATTPRAVSPADDFGDFEEEEGDSIEIEPAVVHTAISSSRPVSIDLKDGIVDINRFQVENLGSLDGLYKTKTRTLPVEAGGTEIIHTTSQRKMWYKLIRKESARNSIQGEDILRVRWSGSDTQAKVHDIVKRWISEDRLGGRTMVGGGGTGDGMFDWNSTTPGTRSNPLSPAQSTFSPASKPRIEPSKRSSVTGPAVTSPRSPSFGWSSAQGSKSPQSPQSPSFGWANGGMNPPLGSETRGSATPQSARSPGIPSAFPAFPKQPATHMPGHTVRSSVDIPRAKPVVATNRPTSLLVESSSRSLFGELSALQSPPPKTSMPQTKPPVNDNMDFSIFEDSTSAVAAPQGQADASFDDDFGDFEESDFQSAPPIPVASPTNQPAGPMVKSPVKSPFSPPLIQSQHPPPIVSKDSSSLLFETPPIKKSGSPLSFGSKTTSPPSQSLISKPADDPWGSFDIFDDPKPAISSAQQPKIPVTIPNKPTIEQNMFSSSMAPSAPSHSKSSSLSAPQTKPVLATVSTTVKSAGDDEFDDWGEMMDTPSIEQTVEWPSVQAPKLPAASTTSQNRMINRQSTVDIFNSPVVSAKVNVSTSSLDIFGSPVSAAPPKSVPSSSSLDLFGSLVSPTASAPKSVSPAPQAPTPPPSSNNLFSSVLVPQRVSTPPLSSLPSSARNSIDISRKNTPVPRNDSFASLSSLALGIKKEDPVTNKRFSTPILPTQQPQAQQPRQQTTKPPMSPPAISSPLASEWDDADFGFFEETPKESKPEPKPKAFSSMGHRPTASLGNISTQGHAKHVSKESVTMSPIVGKRDEDTTFNEIISLLPDLSYMLR